MPVVGSDCSFPLAVPTLQLFSGSADRTIKMWNLEGMAHMDTLFGHTRCVKVANLRVCVYARLSCCG